MLRVGLRADWDAMSPTKIPEMPPEVPHQKHAAIQLSRVMDNPQHSQLHRVSKFPGKMDICGETSTWHLPDALEERPGSGAGVRSRMASIKGQMHYVDELSRTWS